jgi:hypothetical protein
MDEPLEPAGLRRLTVGDCNQFWERYEALRPDLKLQRGNRWSRWRPVAGTPIFIALYIANRSVGMFVRGERGLSLNGAVRLLSLNEPKLSAALGVPVLSENCPYLNKRPTVSVDRETWPAAQAWMIEQEGFYHDTLARIVGGLEM